MGSRKFSGQEIVTVLQAFGYQHDRTGGDHAILKYTHPETGEKRTVTVPLHDHVRVGTLQSIADRFAPEHCRSIRYRALPVNAEPEISLVVVVDRRARTKPPGPGLPE